MKFVQKDVLVTVSKDQRLVFWRIDFDLQTVRNVEKVDLMTQDLICINCFGFIIAGSDQSGVC